MNQIARETRQALDEQGIAPLPHYDAFLERACSTSPPRFGDASYYEIYDSVASDPQWMALSLVTNAEREGDGATRLWNLAACTTDGAVSEEIKQHAIDESMHSRAYLSMVDLVFPDATTPELREQLLTLSPGFNGQSVPVATPGSPFAHEVSVDDLIQMNIAEIRTRIHHLMQRPHLLRYCPEENRERLVRILDRLLHDETKHIAYTAKLIDRLAPEQGLDKVEALLLERLRDFDAVTEEELAARIFE